MNEHSSGTRAEVPPSLNDSGTAFPTLRDYFAGQALRELRMSDPAYDWKKLAERAYDYADAMLEAREVGK